MSPKRINLAEKAKEKESLFEPIEFEFPDGEIFTVDKITPSVIEQIDSTEDEDHKGICNQMSKIFSGSTPENFMNYDYRYMTLALQTLMEEIKDRMQDQKKTEPAQT